MEELKKKVDAWIELNLTYEEKVKYCKMSAQHFGETEFRPFAQMTVGEIDRKVKDFHNRWVYWNN